jgi:hypothetical protein
VPLDTSVNQGAELRAIEGLTPVWAPDDRIIACCAGSSRITGDTEVGQFDSAIFGRQDVGALNVSMDYTLVM